MWWFRQAQPPRFFSKQFIQQNPVPDFIPVCFNAKSIKKQVGIKIRVDLAAEGSVEVMFEASVAEGYVFPFVADGHVAAVDEATDFAVF